MYFFLGFSNIDRQIGFDLETAKKIIKDLASLHAVPLALKLKKPELFEQTIKRYCTENEFPNYPKPEGGFKVPLWLTVAEKNEQCKPYIEKLKIKAFQVMQRTNLFQKPCDEPFATFCHNDVWVNNILQQYNNGKVIKNKFVDFQIYQYANPLIDVVFFLWSSVQRELIKEHFDDLLLYYQDIFFSILDGLGCDTSLYERNFLDKVATDASEEVLHLLFMSIPIFGRKDEFSVDFTADPTEIMKESSVTQEAKDHLLHIMTEFDKRGWIQIE